MLMAHVHAITHLRKLNTLLGVYAPYHTLLI